MMNLVNSLANFCQMTVRWIGGAKNQDVKILMTAWWVIEAATWEQDGHVAFGSSKRTNSKVLLR
jgi:hypothetical protein